MTPLLTKPVALLFVLFVAAPCKAQSGDGSSDDEDQQEQSASYACEHSQLTLSCPVAHVIRIVRANYGRFSLAVCNPNGITSNMKITCQSINASRIVAAKCDGHRRCEFVVSNELFGDPCPGTSKYAEVKYWCETVEREPNGTPKPLPGHYNPLWPTVPIPEKVEVCLHPLTNRYDIYWQLEDSEHSILRFQLRYRVNGRVVEKPITTDRKEDHYSATFVPKEHLHNFPHEFALKAWSEDLGWGDYSEFSTAKKCHGSGLNGYVTYTPPTTTTTFPETPRISDGLREMCQSVEALGIQWPSAPPGQVISFSCPAELGQGIMHYKCRQDGVWDPNGPETDGCLRIKYRTTTEKSTTSTTPTTTTTTTPTTTTEENVAIPLRPNVSIVDMVQNMTRPGGKNLSMLLPSLTRNMTRQIKQIKNPKERKALANYFKESILTVSDELLKDSRVWGNMSLSQQRSTAASLMTSMEDTGLLAASTMELGTSNTTRKSNVVMKLMNVDLSRGEGAFLDGKPLPGSMSKVNQFTIPSEVLRQISDVNAVSVPVVFVVLSNMSEWLTPESTAASADGNTIDARPRREPVRRMVNSDIVSASISSRRLTNLVEPVTFLMEHRQVASVANPKCSFWDTDEGVWSSRGCFVHESNKTHTICKCDHLTSFAVLMDITGATLLISADTRFSLELITYIGCTISIICLMLSWVTFACFKSLDCDRNTIHKHLVFCLMVAQIVLVVGVQQTDPPVLCSIVAGVLHFFFLASFAWMFLEGVQLYVMLIEVFESERSRVLWYYLFGYGVPTIIVVISAAIFPEGYGTKTHCWLSTERGFIWSFVGPVLAVLAVNIVMLGIAVYVMMRHSSISHTMRQKTVPQKMSVSESMYSMESPEGHTYHRPEIPEIPIGYQCLAGARYSMGGSSSGYGLGGYGGAGGSSHLYASIDHLELLTCARASREEQQTWLKGAGVLVVLLGLTWVFGVLYLDNVYHTLIFSYIFTFLNSLQGLFIFLFHCLLNEKVQKEYRRLIRHSEWLPDCVRVRYGGASSSGSREPSSSGNVMSRFLRGKKKKNASNAESSSNSARPFLPKGQRHFSSSVPSSSDGATSSRLSTDTSNNNNRKSSRSSTFRSNGTDSRFLKPTEVNGITGDLSEVLDCSVVDSEFVSEYCQKNLRISEEVKRYSTASEDSGRGEEGREAEGVVVEEDLDRLAALSVETLSNHHAPYQVINSDFGDNKSDGWADSDNVDGEEEDEEGEVCGVAETFVNPTHHHIMHDHINGHHDGVYDDDESEVVDDDDDDDDDGLVDGDDIRQGLAARKLPERLPLMLRQTDSERVLINNAVNKPREVAQGGGTPPRLSPSMTDVGHPGQDRGEEGSLPSHSVPCLKFQPGVMRPPPPPPSPGVKEKDGVMNSLPDLNGPRVNGSVRSYGQPADHQSSAQVKRHSSDGHMYFSPFRFSASEC